MENVLIQFISARIEEETDENFAADQEFIFNLRGKLFKAKVQLDFCIFLTI